MGEARFGVPPVRRRVTAPDLREYYRRRAREYDRVYARPERQTDLRRLEHLVERSLAGHDVLEVACGTGYWTRFAARSARSVLATDAVEDVLDVARSREYPARRVRFEVADVWDLRSVGGAFTAGLAGFWWSHVPRLDLDPFLSNLHRRLGRGALVLCLDNRYIAGSSTPVALRDANGDTWQERRLENGTPFRVLKNFPDEAELRTALSPHARELEYFELQYYWAVRYRVAECEGRRCGGEARTQTG